MQTDTLQITQELLALKKNFEIECGYTKEDLEAVNSPPLTDEELARLKPAKDVLPPSFFKDVTKERRKRG
ncbi:hypothetical protein [Bartonella sp. 1-1C]|uniref:hypothetical protein n=1 Tax=Bartonella sp. 1-1C TaxID=515256 RepID=UPI0001F4C985|nr:hypothetical protein [Bartonella sp. 1-1C]ATO57151.1 hypothetical protein B11Cv2_003690 [Bartonella sp. 1-1C]CBI80280.1 conserved hypothetical protein [Bartonella sp. 1-1C]